MAEYRSHLMFELGKLAFGIDVANVLRVVSLEDLMPVPQAPEFVAGAITVEGNIIPVIDLAMKIELGRTVIHKGTKVVVLEIKHTKEVIHLGVMIDKVVDVISINTGKLIPPVLERIGFDTGTLDGMFKDGEQVYMILNAHLVFERELANLTP